MRQIGERRQLDLHTRTDGLARGADTSLLVLLARRKVLVMEAAPIISVSQEVRLVLEQRVEVLLEVSLLEILQLPYAQISNALDRTTKSDSPLPGP